MPKYKPKDEDMPGGYCGNCGLPTLKPEDDFCDEYCEWLYHDYMEDMSSMDYLMEDKK
jgi:hypothetical protein